MKNIAVLTIDMQSGFLKWLNPEKRKALIGSHKKLYQIAQNKGIDIINVEYDKKGDTIPELREEREREYQKNNFSKKGWSAFTNKKLNQFVEEKQYIGFILTGLYAEHCVQGTGMAKDNIYNFYNCGELTEFSHTAEQKEIDEFLEWASNEKKGNYFYPQLDELLEDIEKNSLPTKN